jgi:predicted dehydrogenase
MKRHKPIRVGVVGIGRGQSFAAGASEAVGMKLVALCDLWKERLAEVGKRYGVATYTSYEKFLEHDLDAVVLANYFHQHAPFAIRALRAGKHVMSETAACKTIGEGVALCRAVERSGRIYMFAENYPFTAFNLEMQRLYRAGEIGEVMYAEGEYNHPMSVEERLRLSPGLEHWRNQLPSTYYCTHALAPLMQITDTRPVSVNALSIAEPRPTLDVRVGDPGSVILCRMNNGAVFRIFGLLVPGHSNWYRLHGARGLMETVRGHGYFGPGQVRVVHDPWDLKPSEVVERTYLPDFPAWAKAAKRAGHGGGDFFTNYFFARAIREGKQPHLDVYRGVTMSAVGILAWKSALEDGRSLPVPDFRREAARKPHEHDDWSPFPEDRRPGQPPPSIRGWRKPRQQAVAFARKVWKAAR